MTQEKALQILIINPPVPLLVKKGECMNEHKFKFELGTRVKDVITGMSGVVMGRSNFITGCDQYGISPTKLGKDGTRPDWEYFDENRLVVSGKGIKLPKDKEDKTGTKKVRGFDGNLPDRF